MSRPLCQALFSRFDEILQRDTAPFFNPDIKIVNKVIRSAEGYVSFRKGNVPDTSLIAGFEAGSKIEIDTVQRYDKSYPTFIVLSTDGANKRHIIFAVSASTRPEKDGSGSFWHEAYEVTRPGYASPETPGMTAIDQIDFSSRLTLKAVQKWEKGELRAFWILKWQNIEGEDIEKGSIEFTATPTSLFRFEK